MSRIGIIGGSGVYDFDAINLINTHKLTTPFGHPSCSILEFELNGDQFYFLPRHGKGHCISPSEINYRANIYALKLLGVNTIVSISAVGSLKEEHAPADFVLPSQFIDWTKGFRERTFFTKGVVGHVSTAHPVEASLQQRILEVLESTEIKCTLGGAYVCIEGPQFSSKAESEIYRGFGADVIGMTNVPEAYLAKEAGMAYATVAMVTDYDCWKEDHCSVEEIMKIMGANYKSAQTLIEKIIPSLTREPIEFEPENKYAILTNPDLLTAEHKEIINTLINE
ncbi:MAG: S-methyl-5'-thioadenosine phosphorylase [Halobacteriovoraceae bacterium]|jgi:5'-methylthioadenosine phosphorylase|nr:S-methyl-5'-thioadenosine phosphorylase [Halobacteriovoraceae bacterium]